MINTHRDLISNKPLPGNSIIMTNTSGSNTNLRKSTILGTYEINFVQWTNNFGGLEKISQEYENIFNGYKIRVIPLRYNKDGLKYKYERVLKYHKNKILLYFEYYTFVLKHKNCIYHLQYPGSRILLLTFLAGSKKIIFHFHGTKFKTNLFDKFVWIFVRDHITVIANSQYTKKVILSRLPIKQTPYVIPNMINPNNFPYSKRCMAEKFIITYAGRFTAGKNLRLIIETAKLMRDHNLEFHLFGDGPEKVNLENFVKLSGLEMVVFFHPFSSDINNIYRSSNLFIFLSAYESFGNVIAEAIMSGLPVLCNKIPSLQEFIKNDLFFLENPEPYMISERILYFISHYEEILNSVKVLSEKVRLYLDPDSIVDSLNSIYQKLEFNK